MLPQLPISEHRAKLASAPPLTASKPTSVIVKFLIELLLTTLKRKWPFLIIALGASVAASLGASSKLGQQTWEASCSLLYTPLPISEGDKSLYNPPDIKTLSSMINSVEILEEIKKEFKINLPIKALDKNLTSVIPNGTKIMNLTFRWENGDDCVKMLNRLTELFIERAAQLRRGMLGGHIKDFEASIKTYDKKLEVATEELRQFHEREHVVDFQNDMANASRDVVLLEGAIEQQKRDIGEREIQLKGLSQYLDDVKNQQQQDVEAEKQFEAANESVADNRRRQDRLRELIDEERRNQEFRAQFDAKKKEFDRVQKLHSKGAASPSELDTIRSELEVIASRMKENERIKSYQDELAKIDKMVVPKGAKKNVGSPIIQQALFLKLSSELQIEGVRQKLASTQQDRQAKMREVARLERLKAEYNAMQKRIDGMELERRTLETRVAALRTLYDLNGGEFAVVTPASPSEYPASSNKKMIIIGITGVGSMVSFSLLLGLQARSNLRTCRAKANQLGLPILAQLGKEMSEANTQVFRGLALRIRQIVPDYGSLIVVSPHSDRGDPMPIVQALAHFMALRDERVLVIDARFKGGRSPSRVAKDRPEIATQEPSVRFDGRPGLGDLLTFECQELEEICYPSLDGSAIDTIPIGRPDISVDSLSTHRFTNLLEELRGHYSILLMIGSSLEHQIDMQILAAMAQGIITVVDVPAAVTAKTRETLSELRMLEAPMLGQLVLDA